MYRDLGGLPAPNKRDEENCERCAAIDGVCLWHDGAIVGHHAALGELRDAAILFARDPEALYATVDHHRQLCRGDRRCQATLHVEGCLVDDRDSEEVTAPELRWGVAHSSVYTVPISSRGAALYTMEQLPEDAELVVQLDGDHPSEWLRFSDGQPVQVQTFRRQKQGV